MPRDSSSRDRATIVVRTRTTASFLALSSWLFAASSCSSPTTAFTIRSPGGFAATGRRRPATLLWAEKSGGGGSGGGSSGGGSGGSASRNGHKKESASPLWSSSTAEECDTTDGGDFPSLLPPPEKIVDDAYGANYDYDYDQMTEDAEEEEEDDDDDDESAHPTAPEVNRWTTLMTDSTEAITKRGQRKHDHRVPPRGSPPPRPRDDDDDDDLVVRHAPSFDPIMDGLPEMSPAEHRLLEESYWHNRLRPRLDYLGPDAVPVVKRALVVAYRAHRGQMRKSGEPFVVHPLEVACLLTDLRMDEDTVVAGLLHDTVEDTDLTFESVEAGFGRTVRTIVEGETKVSKLPKLAFDDYADEQAENLRQMFIAMTDDYRIIVVKLADRLHNMRTLRHMKPEKQRKISRETLDIFAPLAHRMGIWHFKSELEDLAFMYLYPREYRRLRRRLRNNQTRLRRTLEETRRVLEDTLRKDNTLRERAAEVEVVGRTKELYSLWHKMETKRAERAERLEAEGGAAAVSSVYQDDDGDGLDHVNDVVALRVIVTPRDDDDEDDNDGERDNGASTPGADRAVWLCYHVLGLVQHLPCGRFQPVPTRVKDYISFPKPNGYQSLHTSLNFEGQNVEVQIRTAAMNRVAEYGMASHWAYSDDKRRRRASSSSSATGDANNDLFVTPWLSAIKEWQSDGSVVSSRDFVECVRRELLGKRVFVFLRNGKILNLARGATVIDAAFAIHTEVGLGMRGANINGKPVGLSYQLRNGDVVSILTGGGGRPATDWMRYANSRSTRSKLRAYFRQKQRDSLREAGEILLTEFLKRHRKAVAEHSYVTGLYDGNNVNNNDNTTFSVEDGDDDDDVPVVTLGRVGELLPDSNTPYRHVDELLFDVGRRHSWDFLRRVVSKILKVPLSALVRGDAEIEADRHRVEPGPVAMPRTVYAHIYEDKDATTARELDDDDDDDDDDPPSFSTWRGVDDDASPEPVDPAHVCRRCSPVRGDDVVGTRPLDDDDAVPTVHRRSCPIAEAAAARDHAAARRRDADAATTAAGRPRRARSRRYGAAAAADVSPLLRVVPVAWPDARDDAFAASYDQGSAAALYAAEIEVVARDRKGLLADCGEVVSRSADIERTASVTHADGTATFEYAVRVRDVDHLQILMDDLHAVPSVMAVERRFGSKLM